MTTLGWLLVVGVVIGAAGLGVLYGQLRAIRRESLFPIEPPVFDPDWMRAPESTMALVTRRLDEILAELQAVHVAMERLQGRLDALHDRLRDGEPP